MLETEVMETTVIENAMMITLDYNHESERLKQLNVKSLYVYVCVCVCVCVCSWVVCV